MVNAARPFIFTTASSPADTAAGLAALRVVRSAEGDELRARLRGHIERLAPGHPSPVIPVVVGDERDAVALSTALLEQGLLVPAIRPPTVPVGTSRLRVALSAAHTTEQIEPPGAGALSTGRAGGAVSEPVPDRLVVVVGTGTEVGKTWVACRGARVVAVGRRAGGGPQAGAVLRARATPPPTPPSWPRPPARTPTPSARRTAGTRWPWPRRWPPTRSVGRRSTSPTWSTRSPGPTASRSGLVEAAGGLRSPMASDDADGVALAAALMPDVVVLVADAGLGTINSIRLAVTALERRRARPATTLDLVVVLNRFDAADELHRRNLAWLEEHDGLTPGHLDRGAGRPCCATADPPRPQGSPRRVSGCGRRAKSDGRA